MFRLICINNIRTSMRMQARMTDNDSNNGVGTINSESTAQSILNQRHNPTFFVGALKELS